MSRPVFQILFDVFKNAFTRLSTPRQLEEKPTNLHLFGDGTLTVTDCSLNSNNEQLIPTELESMDTTHLRHQWNQTLSQHPT